MKGMFSSGITSTMAFIFGIVAILVIAVAAPGMTQAVLGPASAAAPGDTGSSGSVMASEVKALQANPGGLADTGIFASVGIGTATPSAPLHISSTTSTQPETIDLSGVGPMTAQWNNYYNGASAGSGFLARFARGTKGEEANVQAGDRLGFIVFGGWAGGAFRHTVGITGTVDQGTISATSLPSYLWFTTTPNGSTARTERMRITSAGNVGINTTAPDTASKLNVVLTDNVTDNLAIYGTTTGGRTTGVGGTNDGLNSLGMVGGSYNQLGTDYGVGAYGANTLYGKSGSLGTPNEGVYGYNGGSGLAAYFEGDVTCNGTLSKLGGSFKIDHPLYPTEKYLQHSFVESPDMMNIYNGSVTLVNGEAVVQLPAYFEALNKDFQYQLTCIGSPVVVYIKKEISGNAFTIASADKSNVKVSWQVTGIRHDTWADANRIQVEVPKLKAASASVSPSLKSSGSSSTGKKAWADWSKPPAMSR